MNYGAIVLLGGLAEANARLEPNEEFRAHRIRRMLLAIQRGFVSTLAWSPLAFASAVSKSLVPGATWAEAVGPCMVSGPIITGLGWTLDTTLKPCLSGRVPMRSAPDATQMGVSPTDIIVAITAGWALSGASSPYTATTLLIGSIGNVSARHVGLRWNGAFTLLCGVALSAWVAVVAIY